MHAITFVAAGKVGGSHLAQFPAIFHGNTLLQMWGHSVIVSAHIRSLLNPYYYDISSHEVLHGKAILINFFPFSLLCYWNNARVLLTAQDCTYAGANVHPAACYYWGKGGPRNINTVLKIIILIQYSKLYAYSNNIFRENIIHIRQITHAVD